ncbi:MAG: hypothetical protein IJX53_02915 [Clostridia bacterium]|nr:hypothetical protein [Clostridia bacterium]
MGQTAYTDEQLKKALKKATKAVDLKKRHTKWTERRASKAFSRTYRNVRKIFYALEAEEGADANYRIAEAYIAMAEEYEDCVKAYMIEEYMSMAKMYYENTYKKCEGEKRSRAKRVLMNRFELQSLTEEDGSEFLFYFRWDPFEFRGTTYQAVDSMLDPDVMSWHFVACTKKEDGTITYRHVTSHAEHDDVKRAYFSR